MSKRIPIIGYLEIRLDIKRMKEVFLHYGAISSFCNMKKGEQHNFMCVGMCSLLTLLEQCLYMFTSEIPGAVSVAFLILAWRFSKPEE